MLQICNTHCRARWFQVPISSSDLTVLHRHCSWLKSFKLEYPADLDEYIVFDREVVTDSSTVSLLHTGKPSLSSFAGLKQLKILNL